VISPLIALMQDQVKDLLDKNISAINLGGQITPDAEEIILSDAKMGKYQFIYCSPEKLLPLMKRIVSPNGAMILDRPIEN